MKVLVVLFAVILITCVESGHSQPEEPDSDVFEAIKSTQELVNVISKNPQAEVNNILALNELLNMARSLAIGNSNSYSDQFRAEQSDSCANLKKQIEKLKTDLKAGKSSTTPLAFQMQAAQVLVSIIMTFTGPSPKKIAATFKGVQSLANAATKVSGISGTEKKALESLLAATTELEMLKCESSDTTTTTTTSTTMSTTTTTTRRMAPIRRTPIDCTKNVELQNNRGGYLKTMCWINHAVDYEAAEDFCRVKGMHLFAITRKDEQKALQEASETHIEANDVWLNGRQTEDGSWWVHNPDKKPLLEDVWPTKSYSRWNGFLHYGNYEGPYSTIGGFKQANKTFVCEFYKLSDEVTTEEVPAFAFATFGDESTTTTAPPSTQRCPGCLPIFNLCALFASPDCTCVAGKEKQKCQIIGPYCCK